LPEKSHFIWLTALPAGKELNSKAMQVPGLEFQCLTSRYNVIESTRLTRWQTTMELGKIIEEEIRQLAEEET
jgi:hypothetical protein